MVRSSFFLGLLILCLLADASAMAQVRLPRIIRDSMILQRDADIRIWGWASPGEHIQVRFGKSRKSTRADSQGNWSLQLAPMKAGGPYDMEIRGRNRIHLRNILLGDVWLCSGQSNMVHQMYLHRITYARDIETANYPEIRQFWIPTVANLNQPQADMPAAFWKTANSVDVNQFSAVAYFFARQLYEKYHIPIGIINASVGGTPIEAWMSEAALHEFDGARAILKRNMDRGWVDSVNRAAADFKRRQKPVHDQGLRSPVKWYDTEYVPKGWQTINIPGYWEDQGIKNLDGMVWYRREFIIPEAMTGVPARVFLGRIVDADELFVNGQPAGNTTYQYPQRRYTLPAGLLKPGKNIFVIRVSNFSGKGGFVPDKPYYLEAGGQTLDLKGYWQYKVGAVFEPPKEPVPQPIAAQNQPAALFNGMLAPIIPYTLKGFCWYQGESNADHPESYGRLLPALIRDWRMRWGNHDLPFLFVQLPNFMAASYLPEESNWALLREAALQSLELPHTAMAITIDLGEWNDIHPDNKKSVGDRLALAARKLAYGDSDLVASGPLYQSYAITGDSIFIQFIHTGTGLQSIDGEPLQQFAIAGADRHFVWARAIIDGSQVKVWNAAVKSPRYVRYAWANNPVGANLYNREGLPASPFRTDQ